MKNSLQKDTHNAHVKAYKFFSSLFQFFTPKKKSAKESRFIKRKKSYKLIYLFLLFPSLSYNFTSFHIILTTFLPILPYTLYLSIEYTIVLFLLSSVIFSHIHTSHKTHKPFISHSLYSLSLFFLSFLNLKISALQSQLLNEINCTS